jgi:hypothetical protein
MSVQTGESPAMSRRELPEVRTFELWAVFCDALPNTGCAMAVSGCGSAPVVSVRDAAASIAAYADSER